MREKIFITGITSEIIISLLDHIDYSKYEIYGLTRNPQNLTIGNEVTLIKGDIYNSESFKTHLKKCSVLIHAAAVTHSFNENEYFKTNLEATKRLIDLANEAGIKYFIYMSSNTAGEDSGAYGRTKFLAERYIQKEFQKWLILRPAEVYGSRKKEGVDKYITGVIKRPVAVYPAGVPAKLYPVHFKDVAEIIYKVVFLEKLTNEKISICGPKGYSFSELLNLIRLYKGKHIFSVPVPKYLMYVIEKISRKIPFYIGVIPDQIPRLYASKNSGTTLYLKGRKTFETYLEAKIYPNNKI